MSGEGIQDESYVFVQAEINTGEAVIMGNFTKEEAVNLAVALNTRRNEEE